MKQKIMALALITSLVLFTGCYPDGAEYVDELDVVYTVYDKEYDFQNANTYSLPDKIVILGDEDNVEFIADIYATPILARIDSNLQALGWTKVDNDSNPDVQVLPASWTTTTISYWGGGYWCYWDPYYCGGGWYYPYPVVSSYTTGTLVMNMVEKEATGTDGVKRVAWFGAINGLLQDTYNPQRINDAIDQSFKQSPYLKLF